MKKMVSIVLLLALVGAAVAFYTGPKRTLVNIHQAIATKDVEALRELVDFPAVRESIKGHLVSELTQKTGGTPDKAAAVAMGMALVGPMIDNTLTPEGVVAMASSPQAIPGASLVPTERWEQKLKDSAKAQTRFQSLSKAEVWVSDSGNRAALVIRFERSGFTWRVVGGRVELGDATP